MQAGQPHKTPSQVFIIVLNSSKFSAFFLFGTAKNSRFLTHKLQDFKSFPVSDMH